MKIIGTVRNFAGLVRRRNQSPSQALGVDVSWSNLAQHGALIQCVVSSLASLPQSSLGWWPR